MSNHDNFSMVFRRGNRRSWIEKNSNFSRNILKKTAKKNDKKVDRLPNFFNAGMRAFMKNRNRFHLKISF